VSEDEVRPRGILDVDRQLTDDEINKIKRQWRNTYHNGHPVLLVEPTIHTWPMLLRRHRIRLVVASAMVTSTMWVLALSVVRLGGWW